MYLYKRMAREIPDARAILYEGFPGSYNGRYFILNGYLAEISE